jgi:RND family efflux transporter MFP subunit
MSSGVPVHAPDQQPGNPGTHPVERTRRSDYGNDVAVHDAIAVSTEFEPNTGRRLKQGVIVLAVVLLVAFVAVRVDRYFKDRSVSNETQQAASAPRAVQVVEAKAVGTVQRLALPGQTSAWHASTIFARVNGFVGKWSADIGDSVRQGQVLASIESPDLDAQLAAARAQLKAAEAQVLARKAEAELSKSTYDRWRDSPKGVVSEQEREEKHADYDSAMARLKSAEADVGLDQARVAQYVALAEFKQVTAPFDGVITERQIDIGNLVTAGSTSSTTPLYAITQNDPMRVFVEVPQSAANDLTEGREPVEIDAGGGRQLYTATVSRTSQALNPQARTMRVEVDVANPKGSLVPGMYVKVAFALQSKGAVQVPAAALIFRSGGPQVARVDGSGRINFQSVSIARDDGNVVELGSGVAAGDRLALNVSSQIVDGDRVQANLLDAGSPHSPVSTAQR